MDLLGELRVRAMLARSLKKRSSAPGTAARARLPCVAWRACNTTPALVGPALRPSPSADPVVNTCAITPQRLARGRARFVSSFVIREFTVDWRALSPEASTPFDITGFIATNAKDPKAARRLLDYLASPETAEIYKEGRIFPIH